jgi:hypothetical protein
MADLGRWRPGEFRTQGEAVMAARRDLLWSGGGELVVKGRDGKVRAQDTIGSRDPRRTKGLPKE